MQTQAAPTLLSLEVVEVDALLCQLRVGAACDSAAPVDDQHQVRLGQVLQLVGHLHQSTLHSALVWLRASQEVLLQVAHLAD